MSAIYSFTYPDRVQLLTDMAVTRADGSLHASCSKVLTSDNMPLAVTGRATNGLRVYRLMEAILRLDILCDFDRLLASVEDGILRKLIRQDDAEPLDVLIAGISVRHGPSHFYFHTFDGFSHAFPPYYLARMPAQFGVGPEIGPGDIPAEAMADVMSPDFPERFGADIMEAMRRKPVALPGSSRAGHYIGGGCELTTITSAGVVTKTLRTWPDVPGQMIDPERDGGIVPTTVNPKPNRAEPRAAKARRAA